jgi:hypothetical protein
MLSVIEGEDGRDANGEGIEIPSLPSLIGADVNPEKGIRYFLPSQVLQRRNLLVFYHASSAMLSLFFSPFAIIGSR